MSLRGLLFGGVIGGLGGLLLGILLGALLVTGFGFLQSGGVNLPYDQKHKFIAENFIVQDMTTNSLTKLKHIITGPAQFYPTAPYDVFTARQSYTQSLWVWTSEGDIDVTMTVWGPGNDAKTYLVEFGRHTGNEVRIEGFGRVFSWPEASTVGYASLTVEVT